MSSYYWSSFSQYGPRHDSSDEEENTMGPRRRNDSDDENNHNHQNRHDNTRLTQVLNSNNGGDAERALGQVSEDKPDLAVNVIDGVEVYEDLDALAKEKLKDMCSECGDQPAQLTCDQCLDGYCEVCFQAQHKRGNRAKHSFKKIVNQYNQVSSKDSDKKGSASNNLNSLDSANPGANHNSNILSQENDDELEPNQPENEKTKSEEEKDKGYGLPSKAARGLDEETSSSSLFSRFFSSGWNSNSNNVSINLSQLDPTKNLELGIKVLNKEWFVEKVKYIPLRLTMEERKYLRLIESTLTVSEYTDKIDIISAKDKVKRIVTQLKDVCAILTGLVVASDYKLGQELCVDKEFSDNAVFFQDILELARRHKIRNPEKMRTAYGKLIYLLQDSAGPEVQELLQFKLARPIRTVYGFLQEFNAIECLNDPWISIATGDIITEGRSRPAINRSIKIKEAAMSHLASRYSNSNLTADNLKQCIYSICDNHSYLSFNLTPIEKMISLLKNYFNRDSYSSNLSSLAIVAGRNGARLTHSHAQQYDYCLQSLTLWAAIQEDFFRLWYLSEMDLLDPQNPYRLRNTGQGLNRVQPAPRISRAMHNILHSCQNKVEGNWVGSSVIHLGDHNVPNALMFIDKYNQIARILNPIVLTINHIPKLMEKPDLRAYIQNTFGSPDKLITYILGDFFRHAFDGSGADNFFDAGSCIDGRLTSAWNWCSHIDKKPFYSIFLLAGFQGFDGEWAG